MGRDIPYVETVTVKGRLYRYYRRDGKRWGRLTGRAGSIEFAGCYEAAEAAYNGRNKDGPTAGTFAALVTAYRASTGFRVLGDKTKMEYLRHLDAMAIEFGTKPAALLTSVHVRNYQDKFADRPSVGNARLKVLKVLYTFAVERQLAPANPVSRIKMMREGEYLPWPDDIIKQLADSEPDDELLWAMDLALGSGQRRGDLLVMPWTAFDGDGIEVVQHKTGAKLWIPCHPDLKATLAVIPKRSPIILTTKTGRPWNPGVFSRAFRLATAAAGIEGYVFHGLRKTAAVRLAEAGCSDAEIMSITGHRTRSMVSLYTRGASQKRLATAAIARLPVGNRGKK